MNWHDVKTGLPPEGNRVLAYFPQYQEIGIASMDDLRRWRHDDGAIFQAHEVTHWTNLPDRP
jgi:hypothetical protein